jgi:hypothetical protein
MQKAIKPNLKLFIMLFWAIILLWFIVLMLRIVLPYLPYVNTNGNIIFKNDIAFLAIKQQFIDVKHWFSAFYIHVYTGVFVMFAGFTQFSNYLLKHYKKLHRVAGRIYAFNVLFITGPTAIIMSFYASGGVIGIVAFVLLGILWWGFTAYAIILAKRKKIIAHKNFMMRSYALALSAISLRLFKVALVYLTQWEHNTTNAFFKTLLTPFANMGMATRYQIIAWAGWVVNLIIVEIIIFKNKKSKKLI